jgi:hypothetical protein
MAHRPIEQAPSTPIRRKLEILLAARDRMRAAYELFCASPEAETWELYTRTSDDALMANGAAYGALMELPPLARRSVFVVAGRFAWLEDGREGCRPALLDADTQGMCTCPNCHGAGRNVYLFRDGITREGVCFICGGSGRADTTPPIQPAPTKGIA